MRQWLILKIGYVCQIPQEGGGRAYLANSLYGARTAIVGNAKEKKMLEKLMAPIRLISPDSFLFFFFFFFFKLNYIKLFSFSEVIKMPDMKEGERVRFSYDIQ